MRSEEHLRLKHVFVLFFVFVSIRIFIGSVIVLFTDISTAVLLNISAAHQFLFLSSVPSTTTISVLRIARCDGNMCLFFFAELSHKCIPHTL